MAKVIARDQYGMTFNAPRKPLLHSIERVKFLPLQRFVPALGALGVPIVALPNKVALIHTFNHIVVTQQPWVCTFESSLPRAFGLGGKFVQELLRDRLLLPNCRQIIAISRYAERRFISQHAGWDGREAALKKMIVIHPNLPLVCAEPKQLSGGPLRVLFVGRHWARKGGVVAVRVAREALRRKLPIHVTVVSSLSSADYAQHPDREKYKADIKLLDLANVTFYRSLPNEQVLRLMAEADFTLLPTTHDTYGYSALEGMARGTPAIVTRQAALAEVVQDGINGYALPMDLNAIGEYDRIDSVDWDDWDQLYDTLTTEVLGRLQSILDSPSAYENLSASAIVRIQEHHEATKSGDLIEQIYTKAIAY